MPPLSQSGGTAAALHIDKSQNIGTINAVTFTTLQVPSAQHTRFASPKHDNQSIGNSIGRVLPGGVQG